MSNSKSKKILSLLLTLLMVLSIIPMGVLSASAAGSNDYTLFIDGMVATKNDAKGADVTLSALGITPSGNATDGYVYEFNNVNFETTAATAIKFNNDATINLVGDNTVNGGDSSDESTLGILANNLTIQGEGNLTVTAGNTTSFKSCGIVAEKLIINCKKLEVKSGNATSNFIAACYGIDSDVSMEGGNLVVANGDATGATTTSVKNYGIFGAIAVTAGTITVSSGKATGNGNSVSTAVCTNSEANAKVVDPDDGAVLSYDPISWCYKKGANIATKATLTVKTEEYTLVLSGTKGYQNITTGTEVDLSTLGITASEPTTGVFEYTFNNVNFETTAVTAISFNNDATINLVGENTIKGGNSTVTDTVGIFAENLTVQGEGSLSVVAGNSNGLSSGIVCGNRSLTINGGNLTITAGNSTKTCYGVFCDSFILTKGNVEVKSGNANRNCYGICVNSKNFLVEGGTLNCTSGRASLGESAAVCADGGEANAKVVDPDSGAELTYSNGYYYKGANFATKATLTAKPKDYKLYIDGLNGYQNSTSGTAVDLTTLGITASGTAESGYVYEFNNVNFETTACCAIEFNNDATINLAGKNTVIGGKSAEYTYGIKTEKNLTIRGEGSIQITAGDSASNISYGLYCSNALIIDGGELEIVGKSGNRGSIGLEATYFTMKKGNAVFTSGNSSMGYSYGLSASKSFHMEGGNLTCISGVAQNTSYGCFIRTSNIVVTGGTVTAKSGGLQSDSHVISAAVYAIAKVDAKVVDTDDETELTHDFTSKCYKKGANYATKATITAKPVDYTLYIDGLNGYQNSTSGTAVDLSTIGITATEPTTGFFEYTFNNVNFETTAYCAIMFNSNATINLVGENTIKGGNSTDLNTSGIFAYSLTIQGEGSLTVIAGNSNLAHSYAIECSSLNINGGNLKIIAGNSTQTSSGIVCLFFNMTNGEAEIKTGNDCMSCYGLQCSYSFLMEGGNLNCIAGNATSISYGIYLSYFYPVQYIVTGGKITASSGSVTQGTSAAVFSTFELDAKVVATDDGTVLTYDATSKCYKKDSDIATKATLTAMLCEYNSTKYPTIAKALEAIGTGTEAEHATGTIKLLDNVKENVVIGEFQEIILDLNGYKLENDKASDTITNYGKLSVIDLSVDKTGEIFSTGNAIYNKDTGDLTVTDTKIRVNNEKKALEAGIRNFGSCVVEGNKTEITVISLDTGCAIENYGTITINDGKFTASGSCELTAALFTVTDKVTIGKDAEFILGPSTSTTKAAYYSSVNNTISAGKFSGPIVADSGKTITITGGSFTENPKDMVNSDTHKVVDNGNTVAYRYTVEEKIDTTISAPTTTSKMYDGSALNGAASTAVTTGTTVTYQTKDAADGQYSDESNNVPSLTDAGTLYVKAIARHADYKTVSVEYVLTVSKRDITFTSGSANKTVDGSPLTSSQITVSGDGFAGEEGATYDVIGSQTEIGSSDNSFVVNWNNNTKEANYNVTKVYGTLTVYQDKMKVFAEKKAEALSRLDILDEEFGTVISYRLIKNSKSEIGNMNYDESKTLDENIAAIEAIYKSVEETVMRRHHFIYSCPFMTFMAQFLQPIFRFLVQLF